MCDRKVYTPRGYDMLAKSKYVAMALLVVFPTRGLADIGRVIWQAYCDSFDFAGPYIAFGRWRLWPGSSLIYRHTRSELKLMLAELEMDEQYIDVLIAHQDHHHNPGYLIMGRPRCDMKLFCVRCHQYMHTFTL
jgi:hypothetical protein